MLDSVIRTLIPLAVGLVLTQAAKAGLELPEGVVTEAATAVITAAYYVLARFTETRWPRAGRVLLSLGLTSRTPAYGVGGSAGGRS